MKRGFTLVEILLVLAILVILAAVATPMLRGTMQDAALRSAAEQIRVEFTRANVRAMKTGRIQVFRFEQGGTQWNVQPYAAADDEIEAAPAMGFGNAEEENAGPKLDKSLSVTLPEGVTFASGEALVEGRAMAIEQDIRDANRFEGDWSQPILFYPDGSSSDAFVIVVHEEREAGIRVDLRGMTGAATLGEISDVQELLDQAELKP